jgi:group I intron endonuclease
MENISSCGVYLIINQKNKKFYIGSSKDIEKRWYIHISRLNNNNHPNYHLQAAWNKYGKDAFEFKVKEFVVENNLCAAEQSYLDSADKKSLYNLTLKAYSGGADSRKKPVLLLDLKGDIVCNYSSLVELYKVFNYKGYNYHMINTSSKFFNRFRIVTTEFYKNNFDLIKSWDSFLYKKTKTIYKVTTNTEIKYFNTQEEIAKLFNITRQAINSFFIKNNVVNRECTDKNSKIEKITQEYYVSRARECKLK